MLHRDNHALILSLCQEYSLDEDTIIECVSRAIRRCYGVVEYLSFHENEILCFAFSDSGEILPKRINLTNSGQMRLTKEIMKQIDTFVSNDKESAIHNNAVNVLLQIASEIELVSGSSVGFRIVTLRESNSTEKRDGYKNVAIVQKTRFLQHPELRYFFSKIRLLDRSTKYVIL